MTSGVLTEKYRKRWEKIGMRLV